MNGGEEKEQRGMVTEMEFRYKIWRKTKRNSERKSAFVNQTLIGYQDAVSILQGKKSP